jgi:tellurite resistance protein TerC
MVLIYAAIKTMLKKEEGGGNRISKIMSRWIKTSPELDGDRFFTVKNGVRIGTPLLLCVIVIELTDIVFALDSIPAILAITTDSFIVYTSNIFAILGLRSLYFAIRGSLNSLVYLKYGLGIVLAFVGIKMLVSEFAEISVAASLAFIGSVLLVTIAASVIASRRKSLPDV